jgi:hypothetical protein
MSRTGASWRSTGELGGKLGPRLVSLLTDATVRSRAALGPHEARVRQAATQALIDRAGEEVAGLWRPLTAKVLADREGQLHPIMARHLERISSGAHQWEALAGHLQMGAVSAVSSALSNVLFPVIGELNLLDRNLPVDAQTGAAAVAAGLAPYELGDQNAGVWGYRSDAFAILHDLAQSIPPPDIIAQMLQRGLIGEAEAAKWITRSALPAELHGAILGLRRQLLPPAEAALAVLRGVITHAQGETIAARGGVDAGDFAIMIADTGEPLGLMQLLEAYRRGFIDDKQLEAGIRQSRVRDEWIPTAKALRYGPVSTADAVDAALRGHLAWGEAGKIAAANGVEPAQFKILQDNAGAPPADMQLLELWRRGAISETLVDEGLRQGRLRDSWSGAVKQLKYEPLSSADAIDAWLRGHIGQGEAEAILEENGLLPRDVPAALANAGNPLALMQLLEALRRGFIDQATFEKGFRESRYRNEWASVALKVAYSPMSTADAVDASVQGHLTKQEAQSIAHQNGLENSSFEALWQTAGSPLSRTEAQTLYNRGLLTEADVAQALRESRLKDKYVAAALQLHVREPEPRAVTTALEEGAITRDQANKYLADAGYDHDVIAMLITTAEARSTGGHRQLMTGQVQALYSDRIINAGQAADMLAKLHYTAESAQLIIGIADYLRHHKILQSGIAAIRSHYLAGRITGAVALGDLQELGLPADARDTYLQVWQLDKLAHPKQLTAAQIVKAVKLNLFTTEPAADPAGLAAANRAAGHDRLVALGYDDTDAELLLNGA